MALLVTILRCLWSFATILIILFVAVIAVGLGMRLFLPHAASQASPIMLFMQLAISVAISSLLYNRYFHKFIWVSHRSSSH